MKSMRKVIPAFALLLVSAVILSTASYAWFTMSRQVTANGMNVTITAPNNLLIDDYTSNTWTEIETLNEDAALVPASTVDGSAYFVLDNGTAADSASGALIKKSSVLVAGTTANGAYHDFKYRVKTEGSTDVSVALTDLTITNNKTSDGKSIKPVRVAVLTGAAKDPSSVAGIYNRAGGENQTAGKAISATKAANVDATLASVTYGTVWDQTALTTADKEKIDSSCKLFDVTAGKDEVTYVTIRVWYEGEDTECTSALGASAGFSIEAKFDAIG